ncbi:MAG: substrate-binding domain-containing protein [Thermoguttaceae bacterium]
MNASLTIGLHMTAGHENTRRQTDGILQYAADHTEVSIADFCYPGEDPDLGDVPPWLGKVDGVIVCVRRIPGIMPWLCRGGVPIVGLGADLRKDLVTVVTNARSIAQLAVNHLFGLGLRNFAYVGYRHADGSPDRRRALAAELAEHKLDLLSCDAERALSGTYKDNAEIAKVEPKLVDLLCNAPKPLAVVAINDQFAAAICYLAQDLGLRIPEDAAVLGEQDFEIARVANPPISSIRPATERMGYEAARTLHAMIIGKKVERRMLEVPALELVARKSTEGKRRAVVTDVDRAREFIRQNACAGIRVEDVAAQVRVPLRTFEIGFSTATGRTVGQEIREVRLARAKTLLETTDLPLASIAHLLGMNAASYLNEFFRRWTGTTPGKHRRKYRNP